MADGIGASRAGGDVLRSTVRSALAVVAMVVGALWFVGVSTLHDRVLDPDTYLDSLDDTAAYRRLYSEVLTDDAVRALTDRMFHGLAQAGVAPEDAAAVANAALRLALPPAILREATEILVSDVLAYLRGDRSTLDASVPVLQALRRIDPAAATFVRQAITAASSLLLEHLEEVESFLHALADGVADGQIPSTVPLVGGRLVAEGALTELLDGLTSTLVPPDVRGQVLAAVGSHDRRDALIAKALEALRSSLQDLSDRLAAGRDIDLDLVATILVVAGADQEAVVARADSVRAVIGWFPPASRHIGPLLMLVGGTVLASGRRRGPPAAAAAVGGGLLSSGVAVWWSSVLVARSGGSPLADTLSAAADPAPASAARLMADVDRAVLATVAGPIDRTVQVLVLLGLGMVVAGVLTQAWTAMTCAGRRRLVGVGAVSALAIVAMVVDVRPAAVSASRVCNGHAELCDRRYDDVVQAATHNSMSSPDVVRIWPEHDGNIREQLDFGIRTLMIDASYWEGVDISTQLRWVRSLRSSGATTAVIDTIKTWFAPRPGVYLCHSQCALGAIPMTAALVQIKSFLDDNPDEVVTLMIQDGVTPTEVEAAFVASGITDVLYDGVPGGAWPTLGEMIERGKRLVVFSEQHVSPPGWYLSAFRHIRDTPYRARSPQELSCAPNRGPRDASLFLLNHWIERQAPDRATAGIVNAKDFIVERARRCATERGAIPNFVAVSFYGIGDVLGAVDELNGLSRP